MYLMCCENPNNLLINTIQKINTLLFPFTPHRDKRFKGNNTLEIVRGKL